jgi:hypothetical protein
MLFNGITRVIYGITCLIFTKDSAILLHQGPTTNLMDNIAALLKVDPRPDP